MPQAQTVAVPKRLPLVIALENRASTLDKDSRLVNGYIEKQGEGEFQIYKRPGLAESSRPPAADAVGRGVFFWRDNVYSIFGNTLYKDGVAVSGTVDTTRGVYRFDSCLGATPKLQMGNGVEAYNYDAGAGLVNISDVDFPSSFCKGWAYLNGTTYVALRGSGGIQGSEINDPTDWDPLNIIIAQIEPDTNVALAKQLVYVIDFKQWSVEIFYDAANAVGSPLARVEGAKVDYGCASEDSVQKIESSIFWITANQSPLKQVAVLRGMKAEIISTPPVERLITAWDYTTIFSWQLMLNGHRFYIVTSKNSNMTLACDLDEGNAWYQWTDTNGNYLPIVSSTYNAAGAAILQHETNGRLYTASPSQYTDAGDLITVDIYTPNFDGGTRRGKQLNAMYFNADQVPGSILNVRANDRDYELSGWSNFRNVDLSQERPSLENEGTFNRRAYNFRHRCPTFFRISSVDLQIDLCTI